MKLVASVVVAEWGIWSTSFKRMEKVNKEREAKKDEREKRREERHRELIKLHKKHIHASKELAAKADTWNTAYRVHKSAYAHQILQ